LVPVPTGDLYSFATRPPVTFVDPAWATLLPAGVRSDVEGLRTSVALAEASIVRSVLGITATPVVAAASSSAVVGSSTRTSGAEGVRVHSMVRIVLTGLGLVALVFAIVL